MSALTAAADALAGQGRVCGNVGSAENVRPPPLSHLGCWVTCSLRMKKETQNIPGQPWVLPWDGQRVWSERTPHPPSHCGGGTRGSGCNQGFSSSLCSYFRFLFHGFPANIAWTSPESIAQNANDKHAPPGKWAWGGSFPFPFMNTRMVCCPHL